MTASKELCFKVLRDGQLFSGTFKEETVISCVLKESELEFSIKYDFHEVPLRLMGKAKKEDTAKIVLLPFRIELYINGVLMDEEWPFGNDYLTVYDMEDYGCELSVEDGIYEKKEEPAVLGTFIGAEGWQPEEDVFVGDCMPYTYDGVYHVLYLKDRHHHKSK